MHAPAQNKYHQTGHKGLSSLVGTARSMRIWVPPSTRVFLLLARGQKTAPRRVRWISRRHTITLDQGIELDTRDQAPNRASGPNFHHHISSYLALTRARSGPDARDEGLNSNGSVAASENARLAANRKATQNEACPTS